MHQPHLSSSSLTSKYPKNTLLLCLWLLKASPLLFMLSYDLEKDQPYLFSTFKTFKYVKRTVIQVFVPLKTSCLHDFLHFKLEKHHSYLAFGFITTDDFIYYLFQSFLVLIKYTVPCLFIYSVQKRHCYLSVSTLASRNISNTLFVVSFSLNTSFLPFSGILTFKYIKHTYPVAVYTLNTRSTPYCLFLTTENAPLTFHAVLWPSKHQPYLCPNFHTSKYVTRYLVFCLFPSNRLLSWFVAFWVVIPSAALILLEFLLKKQKSLFDAWFLTIR